jgi:hypothetical protein
VPVKHGEQVRHGCGELRPPPDLAIWVVLSRGVPAVRWIFWDRATSIPGCRRPGRAAGEGANTAIAFDGQLSSQVMVFLLSRPGAAQP